MHLKIYKRNYNDSTLLYDKMEYLVNKIDQLILQGKQENNLK